MEKTITMSLKEYESFIEQKKQLENNMIQITTITGSIYFNELERVNYISKDSFIENLKIKIKLLEDENLKLKNKKSFFNIF